MASNFTTNYQLNQWEPTDQVLRTDFNADNAKLDAALGVLTGNKLGRSQLLQTVTAGSADKLLTLSTTNIDWNEWESIIVLVSRQGGFTTSSQTISCNVNNGSVPAYCTAGTGLFSCTLGLTFLVLFPWHDASQNVSAIYFGQSSGVGWTKTPYSQITSLGITSSSYILSGTTVAMRGIR